MGPFLDVRGEDRLVVIADEDDLFDGRDLGDRAERVPDQGVSSNFEEGLVEGLVGFKRRILAGGGGDLGEVQGEGAEAGATRRAADLSGKLATWELQVLEWGTVTYENDGLVGH